MANPTAPLDSTSAKMGFGIYLDGANDAPAWVRIIDAAVVADETTVSGSVAVASKVVHDAADRAANGPIKIGYYAKAAAPSDVSADGDIVNAWALRNGAVVVNLSAAGALIPGDATNGLDVDITRLPTDLAIVDDAAFTPATTKVLMVGFEADEGSTDSVDEGDGGAARMTLDRKVIVTAQPHTTGGLSTFMASGSDGSSILVATAQAVKASAGQLYGYYAYNPEAAVTFVHFYNVAAASVTVGTTNPLFTIALPAGAAANLHFPNGVTFSNAGWSVAATTTAGGNTAPSTGVSLVAWYM